MASCLECSTPHDRQEFGRNPLSHNDMRAFLEPLHSSVLRIEGLLMELSRAPTTLDDFGSAKGLIAFNSSGSTEGGIDLEDVSPVVPAEDCIQFAEYRVEPPAKSTAVLTGEVLGTNSAGYIEKSEQTMAGSEPQKSPTTDDRDFEVGLYVLPSAPACVVSATAHSSTDMSSALEGEFSGPESAADCGKLRKQLTSSSTWEDIELEAALDVIEKGNISKALKDFEAENNGHVLDKMISWIETAYSWWYHIREPPRNTRLFRFVTSRFFELITMAAIIFNSVLVAYIADWQIQHIGKNVPDAIDVLGSALFFFFLIELLLRLVAHRLHFFVNHEMSWNIFDFVLVSITSVDFIFDKVVGGQAGSNVGFMRLLRFLKLARIFRSVRSFKFFKSLGVFLESFKASLTSLFWGFALLFFTLYLCALVFMQALIDHLTLDKEMDPLTRSQIKSAFGSLSATLLSLYMSVTGGDDWKVYYDIVSPTGEIYGLLFLLFTFFFLFALFNILTGTLVEKAMAASKPDRADLILSQRKRIREQKREFLEICKAMDINKDGTISFIEFTKWMNSPTLCAYLGTAGIEIGDIELFFENVGARAARSGDYVSTGEVTIEHFVEGCMHMRGSATAIDMQRQLFEIDILHQEMGMLAKHVQQLMDLVSHSIKPSTPAVI